MSERLILQQKRLPQELRLKSMTTIEEVNRFLAEDYLRAHNKIFAINPSGGGEAQCNRKNNFVMSKKPFS